MSSSPKPSAVAPLSTALDRAGPPAVSAFVYGEVAAPAGGGSPVSRMGPPGRAASEAALAARIAEGEAQARQAGRQQGEAEARAKFEEQLGRERGAVTKAVADFAGERAVYYRKLEEEVVRLALSIAGKVLHREAQVDPALLMGIVRVALEKIEGATQVKLAVHPQRAADWRRYFAAHTGSGAPVEIVEDAAVGLEQCRLQTAMGTTALGLEVQLKEIELGLMDLLAARPQDAP